MPNFINELTNKLTYATEPKVYTLPALAAVEVTDDDTVTTLASYASNKLKAADYVKIAYNFNIVNASGNNELFVIAADYGATTFTVPSNVSTVTDAQTNAYTIILEFTRINSSSFLLYTTVNATVNTTVTTTHTSAVIDDVDLTQFVLTATNDSIISAGLDVEGFGGYVLVDTF